MAKILLLALGVTFVWFISTQFCLRDFCYLTSDKAIEISASYVIDRPWTSLADREGHIVYSPVAPDRRADRRKNIKAENVIPYTDLEEFFSQNPDCCEITNRGSEIGCGFWAKVGGYCRYWVKIKYKLKYLGEDGLPQHVLASHWLPITKCGRIWGGI